jgi:hypothetical protein
MGAWPGIASFARTASLRYTPGAVAKPRYTQAQVIEALTQSTGFISVAARTLGCSSDTVENYVKKYPAVAEAKRAAREVILDKAESALLKKVEDGDVHAIMFTLKTIGKHRGFVERVETTGADGGPIAVADVTTARDRLAGKLDELAERRRSREVAEPVI